MYSKKDICIVIPIGQSIQSNLYEITSLINTCHILRDYDRFIVVPKSSNLKYLQIILNKENVFVKYVDDSCFGSIGRYNHTFMTIGIYDMFSIYKYMLIAHTNAWIFKDELLDWANKNYDLVAAPWCAYCKNVSNCEYKSDSKVNLIGNGGLCLRKISKFADIVKKIENDNALKKYSIDDTPNEDYFLSNYPGVELNVPSCNEALHFSIESLALKHINSGIVPFGYHNLMRVYPIAGYYLHFQNQLCNIINNEFKNE